MNADSADNRRFFYKNSIRENPSNPRLSVFYFFTDMVI